MKKEGPRYYVVFDGYRRMEWKTEDELRNLQEQGRVIWAKHQDNRDMQWGTDGAVKIIDKDTVEIEGIEHNLKVVVFKNSKR